ncbi:hypothetical protein K1719_010237 [Acacia pycnantha]|nr:hypothetical protein K1719_010237 [Acacia pycnantha]
MFTSCTKARREPTSRGFHACRLAPSRHAFGFCVFSSFGPVQKIAMFDKNGGLLCSIQYPANKRIDERENLTLDHIQRSLVRQEDSIIFYLLERAQYCYNMDTYEPNAFSMDGFHGSLVEYLLKETGKLHAKV